MNNKKTEEKGGLVCVMESRFLRREVPFLVAAPRGGGRWPTVYVLHGMARWETFSNEPMGRDFYEKISEEAGEMQWVKGREVRGVAELADALGVVLVMVNGGQGWYVDSPVLEDSQYESHLIQEMIPWVDQNYSTIKESGSRSLVGHSMGGFGAFRMLCKYPGLFCAAGVRSASIGVCSAKQYGNNPKTVQLIESVFGPFSENEEFRRAEDPLVVVENLAGLDKGLFFSFGVKDGSSLVESNRRLHQRLLELDVPHYYQETPDGHEFAPYMNEMILACAQWMQK